VSFIIYTWCDE